MDTTSALEHTCVMPGIEPREPGNTAGESAVQGRGRSRCPLPDRRCRRSRRVEHRPRTPVRAAHRRRQKLGRRHAGDGEDVSIHAEFSIGRGDRPPTASRGKEAAGVLEDEPPLASVGEDDRDEFERMARGVCERLRPRAGDRSLSQPLEFARIQRASSSALRTLSESRCSSAMPRAARVWRA